MQSPLNHPNYMDYTLKLSKFLGSNILLYGIVCLLVVKIISIVVFVNFPKNIFFADITRTALINSINNERLSLGVQPLTESKKLDQAALLKAKDILEKDYFSHQSPGGITPWYWFSKIGYNYKYAGENLAIGFLNSEDVYRAWLNSRSHKENMTNPNYKEIGTAVLTGEYNGSNITVVVQFFGSPGVINKPADKKEVGAIVEDATKQEVLSQSVETSPEENNKEGNVTNYKLLNLIFYSSNNVFEYAIYALLILTSLALLFNILINFNIHNKRLILRSLIIITLLFITALLNKEIINQIIPHQIII